MGIACFVDTALRAATYPDFEVKDALYCFVGTAPRAATNHVLSFSIRYLCFVGTALRAATYPTKPSVPTRLSFVVNAF